MGPLMCAIIVWKNSLVFHSLDKLTSFFLHAFPPIVVHLLRSSVHHDIYPDYPLELQTNLREDYAKFYNHGKGPYYTHLLTMMG